MKVQHLNRIRFQLFLVARECGDAWRTSLNVLETTGDVHFPPAFRGGTLKHLQAQEAWNCKNVEKEA